MTHWKITKAHEQSEIDRLLREGWEPYGVRKGEFVLSGTSFGWAFANEYIYFKRPADYKHNE